MIPDIKWLNSTGNKLFVIDADAYTLYRVIEEKNDSIKEFRAQQIVSCSPSLPIIKQEQDSVRSFALDHSSENYLALGFTSGRITIFPADLDPNTRGRGPDHAVVVYDLNRTQRSSREMPITIFETNFTEKIFGISWFREDPNLMLISGNRGVRIADIREHGNFQSTLSVQNPLMGVCSEPTHGYLFACHSKNTIFVYDRRFLTFNPLHEIEPPNKGINKLGWHPKRSFHLSATAKDSGNFYNFSISTKAFRLQKAQQSAESAAFHHHHSARDEAGPEYLYSTQLRSVNGITKLGSFNWHPIIGERIAFLPAIYQSGIRQITAPKEVTIINLREDISCDISAIDEFAHSIGPSLNIADRNPLEADRSKVFRTRIENGYGHGNTLSPLPTLIENSRRAIEQDLHADEALKSCWKWIWTMYQSADANELQKAYGTMFIGLKHILKSTKSNSTIKQDEITFRNRIFVNERRLKILKMCNWPNYSDRDECKAKFDEMAYCGGVHGITRAAALSLFSVQGTLCKEYLIRLNDFVNSREFAETEQNSGTIESYRKMAEIVLNVMQKYDGVRVPDYEQVCEELVADHYLLAIVKFLARRDKIYNKIYNEIFESNIDLEDKLAFAALHMDDDVLNTALHRLTRELLHTKPLSALLIVGLEDQPESHQVLHCYLDRSEDIQTASILLIIGNCFRKCSSMQDFTLIGTKPSELLERTIDAESRTNPRRRSLQCVRDYIELLNRWRLWLPKAFLCTFLRPKVHYNDVEIRSRISNIQAVIACNYCGSPIYPSIAEKIENLRTPKIIPYPRRVGNANVRTRTMSCVCRKSLPKCIICRRHLGSQVEPEMHQDGPNHKSMIDHWFVWCSSCNHGGHLAHIRDWFSEYPVCASSTCDCHCLLKDSQLKDEIGLDQQQQQFDRIEQFP